MELALSLEKLNFQKLRHLHDVAEKSEDAQMSDFVEDMLADQVKLIPLLQPICLAFCMCAYLPACYKLTMHHPDHVASCDKHKLDLPMLRSTKSSPFSVKSFV